MAKGDSRTPLNVNEETKQREYKIHLASGDRSFEDVRVIRTLDDLVDIAYEYDSHLMLGFYALGEREEDDLIDFFVTVDPEMLDFLGVLPGRERPGLNRALVVRLSTEDNTNDFDYVEFSGDHFKKLQHEDENFIDALNTEVEDCEARYESLVASSRMFVLEKDFNCDGLELGKARLRKLEKCEWDRMQSGLNLWS